MADALPPEVQPVPLQDAVPDIHSHSGSDQPKIDDFQTRNLTAISISADKITAGTIDASIITVKNIDANKITSGKLQSTDGKTFFDLDNKYIVVNDGTTDRVIIGFLLNGF